MSGAPDIRTIRNIALISHGGGGKTTLAESMLFNGKAIPKRGEVDRGTTVMSTEPEEIDRKVTITPHIGRFNWRDHAVNVVDTPGYIDFLEATRGALNVVGGAVLILSGLSGVKPETERLWKMIQESQIPVLGFVNKMDVPRSDFITVLGEIEQRFGIDTLPVTIPIGQGEGFLGIVDLIPRTAWSAKDGVFTQIDMPPEVVNDMEHYRTQLVEKIVEADDQLLEKYLESGEVPSDDALMAGLREAVLTRRLMAVFCGSASANIGVRSLLNGIVGYLPSPIDKANIKPLVGVDPLHQGVEVARAPTPEDPLSAVVFKTVIDPFAGKLSVVRIFSGVMEANQPFFNATRDAKEKGGNLFKLQGKEMSAVDRLYAGEIGAIAKLDHTHTGDTLCDPRHPILYHRVKFQEPPIAYAVEVDSKAEEKTAAGLIKLAEEDPTLRFFRDEHTHEIILAGMGQTHLTVALDRLKRKFGATATLKTPRVPYLETIKGRARVQGRLKKQTGGRGQFADCWIEVEPMPRGGGFVFEDHIFGGAIPRQYIPSVEKGLHDALLKGIVGGYPVVDVKVKLVDGSYHTVDSSDNAFRTAGSMALREGMKEADAVLLEPIMAMEVTVPDDSLGDVIGELNSRRGRVTGVEPKSGSQMVRAEAPMAEMLDFGTALNGLTSGRGLYTMSVATYQEVPSHIARKVLEKLQTPG